MFCVASNVVLLHVFKLINEYKYENTKAGLMITFLKKYSHGFGKICVHVSAIGVASMCVQLAILLMMFLMYR